MEEDDDDQVSPEDLEKAAIILGHYLGIDVATESDLLSKAQ
jgi:hypothetical protein